MRIKSLPILLVISASVVGIAGCSKQTQTDSQNSQRTSTTPRSTGPSTVSPGARNVPAYFASAPKASSLMPTLTPERFFGTGREAYQVAKEIPMTLAQLPCYCHCDQNMGHKSLQSCFVDEHASMCAVCVDEALLAYQLQKKGLTPAEIRDQVIAQFADQ